MSSDETIIDDREKKFSEKQANSVASPLAIRD